VARARRPGGQRVLPAAQKDRPGLTRCDAAGAQRSSSIETGRRDGRDGQGGPTADGTGSLAEQPRIESFRRSRVVAGGVVAAGKTRVANGLTGPTTPGVNSWRSRFPGGSREVEQHADDRLSCPSTAGVAVLCGCTCESRPNPAWRSGAPYGPATMPMKAVQSRQVQSRQQPRLTSDEAVSDPDEESRL
jgi:hypothetical protein